MHSIHFILPSAIVGFPPPPPALRSFTPSRHHFSRRLSLRHSRSGHETRGLHSPLDLRLCVPGGGWRVLLWGPL